MRRLLSLAGTALAATAVCATPALRTSSREVPVYEDTAVPGAGSTYYSLCATLDLSVFSAAIARESDECAIKTSYVWTGSALPTAAERRELCSCTNLITKLQKLKVPRCSLYRDGREVSYAQLVRYAFGLCSLDGSKASTTTTTTSPSTADTTDLPSSTTVDTVAEPKSKSKSKTGLIVGILVAVVVIAAIAAFVVFKQRQRRHAAAKDEINQDGDQDVVQAIPLSPLDGSGNDYVAVSPTGTTTAPAYPVTTGKAIATAQSTQRTAGSTGSSGVPGPQYDMRASQMGMWDDPVLLAVRIPYDTVFFRPLLSRGGYGEVYKGTYKGETVAIKQLLPERRKDLTQIDAFLSEIKLMSTLEHERIIKFLGVAWNSLSDACVIVEYMDNGDLRSVLTRWDKEEHRPQGFDADKVKIALHIAHALTYLHSLQPAVVHRDLKSKNILLNASYDAKLTDFGVSRERADSTMTGGVGSSLWMAPEVMLGERYDEKADVFSFGVVLSELDTQKLPYDHAKETGTERKVADSAILQMVSLGRLQIAFTEHAHPGLVQLGRDCVQLDAKARPTSAEVLHRVHQVFRSL